MGSLVRKKKGLVLVAFDAEAVRMESLCIYTLMGKPTGKKYRVRLLQPATCIWNIGQFDLVLVLLRTASATCRRVFVRAYVCVESVWRVCVCV